MLQRRGYIVPAAVATETLPDFERRYIATKTRHELSDKERPRDVKPKRKKSTARVDDQERAQPDDGGDGGGGDDEEAGSTGGGGGDGGGGEDEEAGSTGSGTGAEASSSFTLTFAVTQRDNPTVRLTVFFPSDTDRTNLGIGPIREFVNIMERTHCSKALLVVYESLTAPAVLMLKDLELKGLLITFFAENELLYDIYEHVRVPRHVLLSPSEKNELLRELKVTEDLLPRIQKHDPMARYMGLDVGNVVRIERYSATTGQDVYYRVVVDSENFD
jgi:DNA-directed RNA polymerase I, II, and III subunit RPABC1